MSRRKRPTFRGVLAKPMTKGTVRPEDIDHRLAALLRYYGIHQLAPVEQSPAMAMTRLVFHLANEVVPGFRMAAKKAGAPRGPRRPRGSAQVKKRIRARNDWNDAEHSAWIFTRMGRDAFPDIVGELSREAVDRRTYFAGEVIHKAK
jgi:hypothetical protein